MIIYLFFGILLLYLPDFIINFVYFSNIDLFYDIILTKKNKIKLDEWIKNKYIIGDKYD